MVLGAAGAVGLVAELRKQHAYLYIMVEQNRRTHMLTAQGPCSLGLKSCVSPET